MKLENTKKVNEKAKKKLEKYVHGIKKNILFCLSKVQLNNLTLRK